MVLITDNVFGQGVSHTSSVPGVITNNPSYGANYGGEAPTQEKTLIYVVNDKKRVENHYDLPADTQTFRPQKPEVFFANFNSPTEVRHSKIKYESVDFIKGAENGAVDGVPNKVYNRGGPLQDQSTTPEQDRIAQAIYQSLQSGGIEGALRAVDQLIQTNYRK